MATTGTCRMCLTSGVQLRDSHYIPKGVYRQLRDEGARNPHPWSITEDSSLQTSKQLTAPLFCDLCEGRLSREGEDWVLRHGLRADGTFKLRSILEKHRPAVRMDGEETRVYHAANIPEIDVQAVTYFGASIFWRGSVHPWNSNGSIPVPLGPYADPLRRYLLGHAPFPEHIALMVAIREGGETSRLTATPVGKRLERVRIYKFPMPGFAFAMAVGQGLTDQIKAVCLVRGAGNPLAVTPRLEALISDDAVKYLSQQRFGARASQ